MRGLIAGYRRDLGRALEMEAMDVIPVLAGALRECWTRGNTVYLCGNGGSAGNAIHLANDLLYGAGTSRGGGLKVEALSANRGHHLSRQRPGLRPASTAQQLRVKAVPGDVLIVLLAAALAERGQGAGGRRARKVATTFAILGYAGDVPAEALAQHAMHFARSTTCRSPKTCS